MKHPVIENAPGLVWRPMKGGWQVRWQARTDLVRRGFTPKSARLWAGPESELTDKVIAFVQDRANALQNEMLVWGRGGVPVAAEFNEKVGGLIDCYQTDPDSTYRKLRFASRKYVDVLCRRLKATHADDNIVDLKGRTFHRWHEEFGGNEGKIAMAHAMMGMVRTLMTFGMTILENDECARVSAILHKMRFTNSKPRNERLTAEHVDLIRAKAHGEQAGAIALAQAFQFELMLRQKDVIGEWVPLSEPGASEVIDGNSKWLRGIRWTEIDENLVLTHVTSKRQKEIVVDLSLAPMVMEELRRFIGVRADATITRDMLPAAGPIIVNDRTKFPFAAVTYRTRWRALADGCGIPKSVRNMDSRAGAISEATDAGAELEHVRHAATHSDIAMTQRYSRNGQNKTAGVQMKRVEHRNKRGN